MERELIKAGIKDCLPSLEDTAINAVLEKLDQVGVQTKEDLQFVKEDDLQPDLRPIQIRKLLQNWTSESSAAQNDSVPGSGEPLSPSLSTATSMRDQFWVDNFQIPWNTAPKNISNELQQGNRLTPKLMRALVRWIVQAVTAKCPKPIRRETAVIARAMVLKYRASLEDRLNGDVIGNGYEGLLCSLQNRIDNQTRGNSEIPRMRNQRVPCGDADSDEPSTKTPKLDSYGCTKWSAPLPDGEAEESQTHKKEELEGKFCLGQKEWDLVEIKELMLLTYPSQRKDINSGGKITELLKEWPFLFQCLLSHFEELVVSHCWLL